MFAIKTYWKHLKNSPFPCPFPSCITLTNSQICKILSRFLQQKAGHITEKDSLSRGKSLLCQSCTRGILLLLWAAEMAKRRDLSRQQLAIKACRFCSTSLPAFFWWWMPAAERGWAKESEGDISRGWQERLEKRIRNGYLNAWACWQSQR